MTGYRIEDAFIAEQNQALAANLKTDFEELGDGGD